MILSPGVVCWCSGRPSGRYEDVNVNRYMTAVRIIVIQRAGLFRKLKDSAKQQHQLKTMANTLCVDCINRNRETSKRIKGETKKRKT